MSQTAGKNNQAGVSKWSLLLSVCLFALGVAFAIYTQQGRIKPVELVTITGDSVRLPGESLSWVNFWSMTCPPCLKEMPYLEALHKEYEGKMQIVAVSVPYDPPSAIIKYQKDQSFTLPMALDLEGLALQQFTDKLVVPSHYLVDATGKILMSHKGELDEASIRAAIEKYL